MTAKRYILVALAFAAVCCRGDVLFLTNDVPVSTEGVVVWHRPGDPHCFVVDDSGAAWRVKSADGKLRVGAGDRVRVSGISPKWSARPQIDRAIIEKTGTGSVPEPVEMSVEDMYAVGEDGEEGRRDWFARLVAVHGEVSDINRRETFTQLLIGPKRRAVQIPLPIGWSDPLPSGLEIGALVRVKGVGHYDTVRTEGSTAVAGLSNFCVMPERLSDLQVLDEAPFWTTAKTLAVFAVFALAMLVVVAQARRARERDKIAADAARRERLRLTSELHDNFQQLLAGCMFRLGAAMGKVGKDDEAARAQLELLRNSLNHTQSSLRSALWGLTEEAEGPAALSELFKYAASRLPQWAGKVHFTVRGHERSVARKCSGSLLLILQEAVGNAFRHGGAKRVDVIVDFTDTSLVFGVKDDGCGFDSRTQPKSGHLGLVTMRQHAEGLGGTMTVASRPGEGTTVTVRIPI